MKKLWLVLVVVVLSGLVVGEFIYMYNKAENQTILAQNQTVLAQRIAIRIAIDDINTKISLVQSYQREHYIFLFFHADQALAIKEQLDKLHEEKGVLEFKLLNK